MRSSRALLRPGMTGLAFVLVIASSLFSQSNGIRSGRSRMRAVNLWPPTTQPTTKPGGIDLGGWSYASQKADPRDGVPWELMVTPSGKNADGWRKTEIGAAQARATPLAADPPGGDADTVPVVVIADVLWKQWLAADMQDVIGIHYHELVTDDAARILYTLHKVPPDPPAGQKAEPYKGQTGTRIEATLLAPITYHLDQTIAVREDPLKKELTKARGDHELGHSQVSQDLMIAALAGPQDWNVNYCVGRRGRLVYYWKRERIGRSWEGHRDGIGKLLTLRTTVVVVPPTRWSMLLPIKPERVVRKHLQDFNDAIVLDPLRFGRLDRESQARFHAQHGEYESAEQP